MYATIAHLSLALLLQLSPTSRPSTHPSTRPSTRPTSTPSPTAAKGHQLKLVPGQSHTLLYKQFYRIQQTAFGRDTKVLQQHNITFKVQREVDKRPHVTRLRMTFHRIQVHFRVGRATVAYDSKRQPKKVPAQAHILAAFQGHHLIVLIGKDGQIQRTIMPEKLKQALRLATTTHPIYAMLRGRPRKAMQRQFQLQYGQAQWQREMNTLWSYLPPAQLNADTRWTRSSIYPLYGMQFTTTSHPTYQTKRQWHISTSATLHTPRNTITPFAVGSSLHMRYELKGKAKGQFTIDPQTQLPRKGRIHTQISGQIKWYPKQSKTPKRTWPMHFHHIIQWQWTKP